MPNSGWKGYDKDMVAIQIGQTPKHWPEIVQELESGRPVRLLKRRELVATLWPRRKPGKYKRSSVKDFRAEQRRIGKAGRQLATKVLVREDFSAWKA